VQPPAALRERLLRVCELSTTSGCSSVSCTARSTAALSPSCALVRDLPNDAAAWRHAIVVRKHGDDDESPRRRRDERRQLPECPRQSRHRRRCSPAADQTMVEGAERLSVIRLADRSGRGNSRRSQRTCSPAEGASRNSSLVSTDQATRLAEELVRRGALPRKATVDAFHIGIAAARQIEDLLTWNCKHIANAAMRGTIEAICRSEGLTPPIICTPEELPAGSPQ
jgi:hypothetical protein